MDKENRESSFAGRWKIVARWDPEDTYMDVFCPEVYFEFDGESGGAFLFDDVRGRMDCQLTTRNGEAGVEWTWKGRHETLPSWKKEPRRYLQQEGGDNPKSIAGHGWAVLRANELHGMIFYHQDDLGTGFVARRCDEQTGR
jgi:hypothetical protein